MLQRLFSRHRVVIQDPGIAKALFSDTQFAWLWLLFRGYIGWDWFSHGYEKLFDPKWMVTGESLKAFWDRAAVVPATGKPIVTYGWYRDFLIYLNDGSTHVWFAKLVVIGEVAVGIALMLGLFVGITAFIGGFMNMNFMLAGTASTNPVLMAAAVLLMLGWKVAGFYGLDRYLLPLVGTPWQPHPGKLVEDDAPAAQPTLGAVTR